MAMDIVLKVVILWNLERFIHNPRKTNTSKPEGMKTSGARPKGVMRGKGRRANKSLVECTENPRP